MLSGCCQDAVGYDKKWKLEKLCESKGIKPKLCSHRPAGGKSNLAHLFDLFDKKWKLEKLYESKGIKPKLCSYRPVGGKSNLAHLFDFLIKNGN